MEIAYTLDQIEMEVHNYLDHNHLPIEVKQLIPAMTDFQITHREAEYFLADILEQRRKFFQCEKVGHDQRLLGSNITPDHGTEYLICKKCGWEQTINWY